MNILIRLLIAVVLGVVVAVVCNLVLNDFWSGLIGLIVGGVYLFNAPQFNDRA